MKFRTSLTPLANNGMIQYQKGICMIGSCFTEHIGKRLSALNFKCELNPFGILFNPHSIAVALSRISKGLNYQKDDLVENEEFYFSFDHHGSYSGMHKSELLQSINAAISSAKQSLMESSVLFLSFGTAHVFEVKKTKQIVANCHKFPAQLFEKRLMGLDEIVRELRQGILDIRTVNPNIHVVFTVSPVRYLKDGLVNDRHSKSILNLACHELCKDFSNTSYFPSYELLLDDLRDYRFYNNDLIHPSEVAVDYIWQYFKAVFFHSTADVIAKKIDAINKDLSHRPIHPGSAQNKKFREQLRLRISEIKKEYPYISFSKQDSLLANL